ncbi:hypothetical protein [Devosia sp.]|uniref:hypothetical protein n=1 Tax=Devosia sp. TaxID=1871048 RepID=UPI002FC63CC0
MDGFYSAYFTGVAGNSLGLFAFKEGRITGADVGGMQYDGNYVVDEQRSVISGKIVYIILPGHQLVTGIAAGAEPIRVEFPLELPVGFSDGRVLQIPTPSGVVNARFQKLRDW